MPEPELRETVVVRQREIEEALAHDTKGRAVFFVNFPLTPMFISPDAVEKDPESGLFKIKAEYKNAIPAGLIPVDKLNDTTQLSTVLGRVLSLWELKQNPVIIFYVEDRNVDPTQLVAFQKQHPNFVLQQIVKAEDYTPFIGKISEATYVYLDAEKQQIRQCIFATQIINPNRPSAWQILEGQETQISITYLNDLLVKYGKEPITLETKTAEERMKVSTNILPTTSIFTSPTGEAANTCLPTTDTCRSSTPSK